MRIGIGQRIFLGFLFTALVVLALTTGITRWSFDRGFLNYVNESEAERLRYFALTIATAYAEEGGWAAFENDRDRWLEVMAPPGVDPFSSTARVPSRRAPTGIDGNLVSTDPLAISPRISVLDAEGNRLFGPVPRGTPQRVEPIVFRNQLVGNLHLNPLDTLASDLDQQFSQQQTRWIYGAAVFALLLAGMLAVAFSRQIVSPIAELTRGTQALAEGRFAQRLEVHSSDELGRLARNFNVLAETLERNQQAQRQWIADISHELRTPLSVLRGELQAVEDGVRAFDETTRKSLSCEVDRLTKLVNDIYQLSVADVGALRYRKEVADVGHVLEDTVDMFEARIRDAGLELETRYPQRPLEALIDVNRLGQLITNVLENTVRYTDRGGRVRVSCVEEGKDIAISIEDSAPSVPSDALPRLFERLYRVESSRDRQTGGAGLGLAICKRIAHALGGSISASPSSLGGLKLVVRLPVAAHAGG
ncbi:MAG: ATP-binding protein [Rhodospirillaceae bacterium]|nr:ATP-binding protein [Rhodospirillaceae bacterium]MDE0359533.1 ATP-binding protein [Rhodospirillaceae bacterium]